MIFTLMEETMETKKILQMTLATIAGVGLSMAASKPIFAAKVPMAKCYGAALKGKNDCGTAKHACSGQSTADHDPTEWVYVPRGTCAKISGAGLSPAAAMKAQADIDQ